MSELQKLQNEIEDIKNRDLIDIKIKLGRLEDVQSSLIHNQLQTIQRDLTDAKAAIEALKGTLTGLAAATQKPIYRDGRFWAGLFAIPLLLSGGWTIDKIFFLRKPTVLSLIHQAVGTQPVILNAIQTDGDPLRVGFEATLATVLTKKDLLKPAIDSELLKRFDIVHVGIMELGLNHPDRIRKVSCQEPLRTGAQSLNADTRADRLCEDLFPARTRIATALLGLRGYDNVNIDIGVYVGEFPRNDRGELDLTKIAEPMNTPRISQVLKATLDEKEIPLPQSTVSIEYKIGAQTMKLAHLAIEDVKVQTTGWHSIFPLHTLTMSLAKKQH